MIISQGSAEDSAQTLGDVILSDQVKHEPNASSQSVRKRFGPVETEGRAERGAGDHEGRQVRKA